VTEAEIEFEFAKEQIRLSEHLHSLSPREEIEERCSMAGCDEKRVKAHRALFLKKRWNPHPSDRFARWWTNRGCSDTEQATGRAWSTERGPTDAAKAYNCEAVRECYRAFMSEQRTEIDLTYLP